MTTRTQYDWGVELCRGAKDEDEATARLIQAGWPDIDPRKFARMLFGDVDDNIDISMWCWKGRLVCPI